MGYKKWWIVAGLIILVLALFALKFRSPQLSPGNENLFNSIFLKEESSNLLACDGRQIPRTKEASCGAIDLKLPGLKTSPQGNSYIVLASYWGSCAGSTSAKFEADCAQRVDSYVDANKDVWCAKCKFEAETDCNEKLWDELNSISCPNYDEVCPNNPNACHFNLDPEKPRCAVVSSCNFQGVAESTVYSNGNSRGSGSSRECQWECRYYPPDHGIATATGSARASCSPCVTD